MGTQDPDLVRCDSCPKRRREWEDSQGFLGPNEYWASQALLCSKDKLDAQASQRNITDARIAHGPKSMAVMKQEEPE